MRNIAHYNPLDLFNICEKRPHHLICSFIVLAIDKKSRNLDLVKLGPQVIVYFKLIKKTQQNSLSAHIC